MRFFAKFLVANCAEKSRIRTELIIYKFMFHVFTFMLKPSKTRRKKQLTHVLLSMMRFCFVLTDKNDYIVNHICQKKKNYNKIQ